MTATTPEQIEPDEIATQIVAFVRREFGQQHESVVLQGIWLAFQSAYGPLAASQALRAYSPIFDR